MLSLVNDYRTLPDEAPYGETRAVIAAFRDAIERGGMKIGPAKLWQGFGGLDYGYAAEVLIDGKQAPRGLHFSASMRGSWRKFRSKIWYVGLSDTDGVPFVAARSSGSCRTRTPEMLAKWFDEMADLIFLEADRYVRWSNVLKKLPCGVQDALVQLLEVKRRGREMERLTTRTLLLIHKEYEKGHRGKNLWNLIMTYGEVAMRADRSLMRLHTLDQCWTFTKPHLDRLYDKGLSA